MSRVQPLAQALKGVFIFATILFVASYNIYSAALVVVAYMRWTHRRMFWSQEAVMRRFLVHEQAPARGVIARFKYMSSLDPLVMRVWLEWYCLGTRRLYSPGVPAFSLAAGRPFPKGMLKGLGLLIVLLSSSAIAQPVPPMALSPLSVDAQYRTVVEAIEAVDFQNVGGSEGGVMAKLYLMGAYNGRLELIDLLPAKWNVPGQYAAASALIWEYSFFLVKEFPGKSHLEDVEYYTATRLLNRTELAQECAKHLPGLPACVAVRIHYGIYR